MKTVYKNRLPHIAPIGASFFVTFRLADAIPRHMVKAIKLEYEAKEKSLRANNPPDLEFQLRIERKKMFGKYEHQLDHQPYGSCALQQAAVAEILVQKLRSYDGVFYNLWAYCIMSNHVHVLFDFSVQVKDEFSLDAEEELKNYVHLDQVMKSIKGGSALEINRVLKRSGRLWARDSYDHFVRDAGEWERIKYYIRENPVKAGMVKTWEEHPFTFLKVQRD